MYNRYLQTRQDIGEGRPGRSDHRPVQRPDNRESPAGSAAGLKGILNGLFGNRVDTGDLLLYLVLLLLYLEKEDEELLITLAALVVLSFSDQEDRRNS